MSVQGSDLVGEGGGEAVVPHEPFFLMCKVYISF